MAKSKYVLKRKSGSRKKKHVRFNLTHSRNGSGRTLRRSSTLGFALKKSRTLRRGRFRSRSATKGKYRTRGRGRTRSRLGGFRGGYGPGGGPVGAPWDGGENLPGYSVQGLPNANHYAYNKGGIGVGGTDIALSTRTIGGGNQRGGGGLMDLMPQDLKLAVDLGKNAISSTYDNITMNSVNKVVNPLPTEHYIDSESTIVFPNNPFKFNEISQQAAIQAASS
jgi:hypothetical protein